MKNKSARHKEENTFKFQPFSERLSTINIDVFHRVDHVNETDSDDNISYFHQDLQKWIVLNLTTGFESFKREIKADNAATLITLPQLILHKDHVVDTLVKYLRLKDPLYLQPLLSLTASLAKDLRKEFYEYYPRFYDILFELLETKDTEQLEWVFSCLAYFFKFLWRFLIKDIKRVFSTILPLLSENKPEYINNFAAESFAFVARKVKDKKSFLDLLLKTVCDEQEGIIGCGKLLFEVIKGVNGQFHSCADEILPFFFESLSDSDLPQDTLLEILEYTVAHTVDYIAPQKSEVFWNSISTHLDKLTINWKHDKNDQSAKNLENLLKLLGQAIEHKNGKIVQNPRVIIQRIVTLLSLQELPEDIILILVKITIVILLSNRIKLSQEDSSLLVKHVLSLKNENAILYFVDNITEFSSFQALILPQFLKFCFGNKLKRNYFEILTNVVLKKAPLCKSGVSLKKWSKYPLDIRSNDKNHKIENDFLEIINQGLQDKENLFCVLVCIPHFNLLEKDKFKEALSFFIQNLLPQFKKDPKKTLFFLNLSFECLLHLNHIKFFVDNFHNFLDILLPSLNEDNDLCLLKTLSLIIAAVKNEDLINIEVLRKLHQYLETNFNSPFHEVRLLTTFIYTIFENIPEFDLEHSTDPEIPNEKFNIFTICHAIEAIDPQIQTYRDQILNLEKLDFDKPQMIMCNQTEFKTIALRYMCGMLYINFQLLWEPTLKIIETHAHGLDISYFWKVYGQQLKTADTFIDDEKEIVVDEIETKYQTLADLYQDWQIFRSKPDFVNRRLLLWKGMVSFADVAEAKTRDVSELLLNFYMKEFTKYNSELALTWNIKQNESEVPEETLELDDGQEEEDDVTPKNNKSFQKKSAKMSGKTKLKTFLQYLSVFSKVKSPKSMYRESELNKLYYDLLQHKNSEVQKAALDCLLTYKQKFLIPYKENLYNLIDDKNFKNELATFNVDREGSTVSEEYRENLMPVVLRIVYSKMNAKIGLRTGGKSAGQHRRTLVIRFLGGCHEKEKIIFIKMIFKYFDKYREENFEKLAKNVDLEKFIPPKRLQSSINMLNVILEQFGDSLANELLAELLNYVHIIGAFIKGAFQQMASIHVGYQAALKVLRTSCLKLVHLFFEKFEHYEWTSKKINDTFDIFVWPYLDKLNTEGIHSPTVLLKLFTLWGSNPRYFSLLVKYENGNEKQYALPKIMELLLNGKCHHSVSLAILEMIEKLLILQPDEEDIRLAIPIDNVLPIDQTILDRIKTNDNLNYGSCILLPHIPSVLIRIKKSLERKSKNLNRRELFILSRISELVWEADISEQTLELLLPVVLKKCTANLDEVVVNQFLISVRNLLQNVQDPMKFLKKVSPLFGEAIYSSGRKILESIIDVMVNGSDDEQLKILKNVITELNAFDAKWIDQPDFQRRHDSFKVIYSLIQEDKIELQLGILLVFNSYYFLSREKDLSIKENASHLLRILCPYLLKKYQTSKLNNEYLLETLFNLIRKGMKNKNDDLRNECIALLGHLARKCPENHFILRDLHVFTNETDLEVDFFENLVHLQVHRHARAMVKFCQILKEQNVMLNAQTMTRFILPLTSFYLCNEKYLSKNSVVDAAIETVGIICRILPWHHYEGLLKFYLSKLRGKVMYQKQLVRLTVAILDSFHFDLHKAHKLDVKDKNDIEKNVEMDLESAEDVKRTEETAEKDDLENTEKTNTEEDISEILDKLDDKNEESEDDDGESDQISIKICDKTTVLCKSTATRVIYTIQTVLLPQMYRALAEMTQRDSSHKINRKMTSYEQEEEDLIKVPLSLAVVKLLQRLPEEILENNLPGIFMKTCTFLKSHLESVRRVARETLQKMMLTLGPSYLGLLLAEMSPLLQRGFHAHVLIFTVHGILNCLKDHYKPNDIDKVLLTVLKLCNIDLFGILSEEKEIAKIKVKTSEAKSSKSLDTYQTLAQFITEKCLMDLVFPIKKVLENSTSFKTIYKAQECLRCIAAGLVDNQFISTESLLKFAYGTASEKIPQLIPGKDKQELTEKERNLLQRQKPDCFIIPKAPVGRSGVRVSNVKTSDRANAHLLVEFGLRLCFILLKRDRLREEEYRPFMDPFVELFKNCLNSKHVKLCTVTLQCLNWILKYELPSMKEHIKEITSDMFSILHKYAAAGLSKGDNFDLVVAAFKAMSVLLRDVKYHTIEKDQLRVLLLYVEQDMYDHDRQAVAFNLLKAILARKLIVPEIHEIMGKVAEMSIISELNHVRNQARGVFHQFLMDYPLGKKLEAHISFYLSQTSFEMQYGRESALEMIQTLINSFPLQTLTLQSGTILITLGARLVNEEVPDLKKTVAACLTTMLNRLPKADRQPLFEIVTLWFSDKNMSHRRLAAQLCGIFVNVEKTLFEIRLPVIIPLIMRQFGLDDTPGKFVKLKKEDEEDNDNLEKMRIRDHHYFQVLQLLLKLCAQCPNFLKQTDTINNFASHCQTLLKYPHDWVRLAACQFLGFVLASTDIEHLSNLLLKDEHDDSGYLTNDPNNSLKSLTLDLCDQLQPEDLKSDLAEQVIKNLVFVARVLQKIPIEGETSGKINLLWLIKRLRKIVNSEVVENPSAIVIRTEVFKWIAGVTTALEKEVFSPAILRHLMAPLVREMLIKEESNAPLRQLSKEVRNIIEKKVGFDRFTETLSELERSLSVKKAERKRSRNQLAVVDPELYAKKKIKRNEKKKDVKKRKIAEFKGVKKNFKKRKITDLEDNSEVM